MTTDTNPFPGGTDLAQRYRTIQTMVVDYAIGLAILGLNPFPNLLTLSLLIAAAILVKMLWDIGRKWRFPLVSNPITLAGGVGNIVGSLTMALMAWVTLVFLGTLVPVLGRFAFSAALMTLTWTLGAAANQFCLNAVLERASTHPQGETRHG